MIILFPLLVISFIGTIESRRPDIARVRFLRSEASYKNSRPNRRRSLPEVFNLRTNDYDDYSGRYLYPRAPLHFHDTRAHPQTTTPPLKVHPPREDPRLYYQTDAYHKEMSGKNIISREVAFVYPGKEVVRGNEIDDVNIRKPIKIRGRKRDQDVNVIPEDSVCIRCPNDRTLIARAGFDKVLLQPPRLLTCSGHKAPRDIHLIQMYGPKFGSLVPKGSHMIIGRITYNGHSHHLCKMHVHIITQTCTTPSYLVSHCGIRNKPCNFTCRDPKMKLVGESSLQCGRDMKWMGNLPVCRVCDQVPTCQAKNCDSRFMKTVTWCKPPPPPSNGRISCTGGMLNGGLGFMDGAKCRVRCARGYHWSRAPAVCRKGLWSQELKCILKRSIQL